MLNGVWILHLILLPVTPCESESCVIADSGNDCDNNSKDVLSCTWNPTPPFCGSNVSVSCGIPDGDNDCAIEGCSYVSRSPELCVPNYEITCIPSAVCNQTELSRGCKTIAATGVCTGNASAYTTVRPLHLIIIVFALLIRFF